MILGIDAGLTGGFAFLREGSILLERMPLTSHGEVNVHAIRDLLIAHKPVTALIEKPFANPKNGAFSMLRFGKAWGLVVGCLLTFDIPLNEIRAQEWQKVIHAGIDGANTKAKSMAAFRKLFEGVDAKMTDRSKIPHGGLVEASLIAEYGRRLWIK